MSPRSYLSLLVLPLALLVSCARPQDPFFTAGSEEEALTLAAGHGTQIVVKLWSAG